MPKARSCHRCFQQRRVLVPAVRQIDERDLCLPCIVEGGLDPADGTPIVQPTLLRVEAPHPQPRTRKDPKPRAPRGRLNRLPRKPRAVRAPQPPKAGKRESYAPRECKAPDCDVSFHPMRIDQLFCSAKCLGRQWKRDHPQASRAVPRERRLCAWCGQSFVPKQAKSQCCSTPCNKADYQRRLRRSRGAVDKALKGRAQRWWKSLDSVTRVQVMEQMQA